MTATMYTDLREKLHTEVLKVYALDAAAAVFSAALLVVLIFAGV